MKRLLTAAVALIVTAGAALADPVEGTWQTQVDEGNFAFVEIKPCGDKFCGTISRTFNSDGEWKSGNIGKNLVWDMTAKGNGDYGDGKIWQPSKDKVYKSKMSLNGDRLNVSGCIGPICKKQTWARVK
ncbi:DUF2147 domain-containing protein [Falsihalocynthiibacter sp. SS001]|uniref:DUF2147 domain-containing protein n=1 Tax=Falsihalocynthiibacter sp. SS001 TaxID=3349698 RepID=UPI0036D35A2C